MIRHDYFTFGMALWQVIEILKREDEKYTLLFRNCTKYSIVQLLRYLDLMPSFFLNFSHKNQANTIVSISTQNETIFGFAVPDFSLVPSTQIIYI